jgi:hypothetical protein
MIVAILVADSVRYGENANGIVNCNRPRTFWKMYECLWRHQALVQEIYVQVQCEFYVFKLRNFLKNIFKNRSTFACGMLPVCNLYANGMHPVCYRYATAMLPVFYRYATVIQPVFYLCTTGMLLLCNRYATGMIPACYRYATVMLPVCYRYATVLLPVCYLYVTGMIPVCYQYATCILPVWYLYATGMLPVWFDVSRSTASCRFRYKYCYGRIMLQNHSNKIFLKFVHNNHVPKALKWRSV